MVSYGLKPIEGKSQSISITIDNPTRKDAEIFKLQNLNKLEILVTGDHSVKISEYAKI